MCIRKFIPLLLCTIYLMGCGRQVDTHTPIHTESIEQVKDEVATKEKIQEDTINDSTQSTTIEQTKENNKPQQIEQVEDKTHIEGNANVATETNIGNKTNIGNQTNVANKTQIENVNKIEKPLQSEKNTEYQNTTDKNNRVDPPSKEENLVTNKEVEHTVSISINCSTILDNKKDFNKEKLELLPETGVILASQQVTYEEGETVFDVLVKATREHKIHMEYTGSTTYKTNYIEGIHNIYEFDCGPLSGWMYQVNGVFPNYGCSNYKLKDGDIIEWVYTCDLGKDVGAGSMLQEGES